MAQILNSFPVSGHLSPADNLCKQLRPKSGLIKCPTWSESKLLNILMIYLIVFPKINFNQIYRRQVSMQIYPASKGLYKQF